jgi:hypothetical protein
MWCVLDADNHTTSGVTYRLGPAARATPADRLAAQERERLLAAELTRVRDAAAAWRNGLGGLLTALVAFSLIKGQSDISQLARAWAVGVGILLLAAVITGAAGALLLIRAANGRPTVSPTHKLLNRSVADHVEALDAVTALRRGIGLTLGCTILLVAAVGVTWYGPQRVAPSLQITSPTGIVCGAPGPIRNGRLVLITANGDVSVNLAQALAVVSVPQCQETSPADNLGS